VFTSLCIVYTGSHKDVNVGRSETNSCIEPFQKRRVLMLTQTKHNTKTTVKVNILGVYGIVLYNIHHTGKYSNTYVGESFSRE